MQYLGSTSSGTFTYKWNRDPHKQHFSSFYCSQKPHIAWCNIIQIDFQMLRSRLQYTQVPIIPSSTSSCIDACLYSSWHTIHKFIKAFIKALLAQIVPLLNAVYVDLYSICMQRFRNLWNRGDAKLFLMCVYNLHCYLGLSINEGSYIQYITKTIGGLLLTCDHQNAQASSKNSTGQKMDKGH